MKPTYNSKFQYKLIHEGYKVNIDRITKYNFKV